MNIPPEFRSLVRCFHQDSIPEPFSETRWIENQIAHVPEEKRQALRVFLDEVLGLEISGAELRKIWESGDPDFLFPDDGHLRLFLRMVREQL